MNATSKTVAVFGATGMLGRPVVEQLVAAGYHIRAMVRDAKRAASMLPKAVTLIEGDLHDATKIAETLKGADTIYLSLGQDYDSKATDWQPEEQGLATVLEQAKLAGLPRVVYLSALIIRYEGYKDWWVFQLKHRCVAMIKAYPGEWTIFYPSQFMDTIPVKQTKGKNVQHAGKGMVKLHPVSAADYGKQVAKSMLLPEAARREFPVQGPEAHTSDEILDIYLRNHSGNLKIQKAPMGLLKFIGLFSRTMSYLSKIIDTINNMPEPFESQATWDLLGKPEETVAAFAKRISAA